MTRYGWLYRRVEALRLLAQNFTDVSVLKVINELTAEYKACAVKLERQERIRTRAYYLWEKEGRPEGRAPEHWCRAEQETLLH
jgi:Protein of unknown function (DUF2934)